MLPDDDTAERIGRLRKELGLTQQALASFVGVSQRTVSRWERGVDHPSAELWKRLTALLADKDQSHLPSVYEVVRSAAIPLALVDDQGHILAASATYAKGGGDTVHTASTGSVPMVLVIEDDEAVLKATRAVLKRWQFLSIGVSEGEAALAMATSGEIRPDGAIIDFLLPGKMDGVDTALALREIIPDLPVLIVTGEGTPERMHKIAVCGFPVVTKPIDPEQMQISLLALLPAKHSR